MAVAVSDLVLACDQILSAAAYTDYAPNGLQVEGSRTQVSRLALAVSASQDAVDAAVRWGADALLVHHGWFWKGESAAVVGMKYRRLRALIEGGISLLAYHLPLDGHCEHGNAAQIARRLGARSWQPAFDAGPRQPVGVVAELDGVPPPALAEGLRALLGHEAVMSLPSVPRPVARLGIVTGGGQRYLPTAAGLGCDGFLTGEASEQTWFEAVEMGISFFACGHHATERYGVQSLGAELAQRFGVETRFIEQGNPF